MKIYVIIRDDNDGSAASEVIGAYTLGVLALDTVKALNFSAAGSGATERYRVIRIDANSNDRLPGQWVRDDIEYQGIPIEGWKIEGYVPLSAMRLHRPDWLPWPTVAGAK